MGTDGLDTDGSKLRSVRAENARLAASLRASEQREAELRRQFAGTAAVLRVIATPGQDVRETLRALIVRQEPWAEGLVEGRRWRRSSWSRTMT